MVNKYMLEYESGGIRVWRNMRIVSKYKLEYFMNKADFTGDVIDRGEGWFIVRSSLLGLEYLYREEVDD